MSAKAFEAPEGFDAIHEGVYREAPCDRQNSELLDWHPDLDGPHWQPTGGPNGTPFSIAIGTPGKILSDQEKELWESYRREMENAHQIIIPDDEEEAGEEAGPPHRDPVEGSTIRRKMGTTATGWEAWLDDSMCVQFNFD